MLNGLPPSLDDLLAFLSDSRPDAYERFVDRSLLPILAKTGAPLDGRGSLR